VCGAIPPLPQYAFMAWYSELGYLKLNIKPMIDYIKEYKRIWK
jgi:hypothetical protein